MTKIEIIENGEIIEVSIGEILQKYDKLIYKICNSWHKSFLFDQAIEVDDLAQDLRLKFLNDLHNYDYTKNEYLIPYMNKIAKNFFISKRAEMLSNNKCPLNENSQPELLISTNSHVGKDTDEIRLIDILICLKNLPDREILMASLVEVIQKDLDKIKYSPNNFVRRIRSFCRVVFDTLYFQEEEFLNFVMFDFRCKQRYAKKINKKSIPRSVRITSETLARYLKVKRGAINYANRKIRQVLEKKLK